MAFVTYVSTKVVEGGDGQEEREENVGKRLPNIETERIAVTREGRAVTLVKVSSASTFGADPTKVRVLLFAEQHGDEPSGKEALLALMSKAFAGKLSTLLPHVDLLIVPQVNPDGSARRQRRTADGIDPNRAHVLLHTPEVRALHDVFHAYLPHVTVDIHEYKSFSPHWTKSGVVRTADVQLGLLTNLNSSPAIRSFQRDRILPYVAQAMFSKGYLFHEYIVGSPGKGVRHSTTEMNDGRQSFGMFNTLSFLQEGRCWKSYDEQLERRVASQLTSLEALLIFCSRNREELLDLVNGERARMIGEHTKQAVLRMDHVTEGGQIVIPGLSTESRTDTLLQLSPYYNRILPLVGVSVPSAYVIPAEQAGIISVLDRHHVRFETVRSSRSVSATAYTIGSLGHETLEEEQLLRPEVDLRDVTFRLRPGDVVVPTTQMQKTFLASFLEPLSMWGVGRYREFSGLLREQQYPILRLN